MGALFLRTMIVLALLPFLYIPYKKNKNFSLDFFHISMIPFLLIQINANTVKKRVRIKERHRESRLAEKGSRILCRRWLWSGIAELPGR
mgnify:CR=1 FL=1|jgi:hypothetical protein